jgi:hypothetical protein
MCVSGLPGAQSWKCSCDVTFSQPKHSFVTMVATRHCCHCFEDRARKAH